MTEEKALKLFARCYNRCDFSEIISRLHKNATFEAYNRIYRHIGRESVVRYCNEKAAELRALPRPFRAYKGFVMTRHDLINMMKCETCLVLTEDDPRKVLGIVRIKCTMLRILDIRILNPVQLQYTRGEFYGKEGK